MLQFKTISLRTLKGIENAERLARIGWKISCSGFDTIQFYKEIIKNEQKNNRSK
jgi:hypothetical protein